jgi:hypothetical protein
VFAEHQTEALLRELRMALAQLRQLVTPVLIGLEAHDPQRTRLQSNLLSLLGCVLAVRPKQIEWSHKVLPPSGYQESGT